MYGKRMYGPGANKTYRAEREVIIFGFRLDVWLRIESTTDED